MADTKVFIRDKEYGATTAGTATAYTLAILGFGAYEDLKSFNVKFHVTNGVSATLNINGIGAKPLVDQNNTALPASLFDTDGIYTFAYNVTNDNFCYLNATTSQITPVSGTGTGLVSVEIAGENITTGDAVYKGLQKTTTIEEYTPYTANFSLITGVTSHQAAQSFGFAFNAILREACVGLVNWNNSAGFNKTFDVQIFAATGVLGSEVPTGLALFTQTVTAFNGIAFTGPVSIFPELPLVGGNRYCLVINGLSSGSTTHDIGVDTVTLTAPGNFAVDGVPDPTREMDYALVLESPSYVYRTDADNFEKAVFYGIATQTVSTGSAVTVLRKGLYTTSGLTAGQVYYVSATTGQLSTTPGATAVRVGYANTTTELVIDEKMKISLSNNTDYYTPTTGMISVSSFDGFVASHAIVSIGTNTFTITEKSRNSGTIAHGAATFYEVLGGTFFKLFGTNPVDISYRPEY